MNGGWIGQTPLWTEAGTEAVRPVSVAVSGLLSVSDGQSPSLPGVQPARDKRKTRSNKVPELRQKPVRRKQDNLEPMTVQLEDGLLVIRSDGLPVRVKPRPRTTQTGHVYMPAEYMTWKRTVAGKVAFALPSCPVFRTGPVRLDLWVFTGKGDADNLAGGIMDALNGIAWLDDEQVTDLVVRKRRRHKTAPRWLATVSKADVEAP